MEEPGGLPFMRSHTVRHDRSDLPCTHALEKEMATHSSQYSCLENPRDRGAWWAAICGVTQSRTQLKRFSNSSSKQEVLNVDILGISKLRWTGTGEFNSDDHYIYFCGQESLRRNGVAIMVNKRAQNAVLGVTCQKRQNDLFVPKANHSVSR